MQLLIRNKGPQVVCPAHPNQVRTADIQNVFCRSVCRKYIMVDLKGTWKPERTAVRCSDGCVPGRVPASNASVDTLAIFTRLKACKNTCWGVSPNPFVSTSSISQAPPLPAGLAHFTVNSFPSQTLFTKDPVWDEVSHRSVCGTALNGSVPYRRVRR